jgi:iron complex transport system permease protein
VGTAAHARSLRAPGLGPFWVCAAVAFLLASIVVGLLLGPVHVGVGEIVQSALAYLHVPGVTSPLTPAEDAIVWQLRLPRVVLAALVGAMLAVAGATYQGVFRNPLADPYLLGIAAGAGLGATLAISYLPRSLPRQQVIPPAAFLGGALAVGVTYLLAKSAGRHRGTAVFILAGVTVASFFTAVQTFVQQQNSDTLQEVYSWILGRLPSTGWSDVVLILPYVTAACAVIFLLRRSIDVLSLGDDEAASLGVDVGRLRLTLVIAATIGTAAAVAVSGLIAFVGIIVPHAIRLVVGGSSRVLLPLSMVVGAGLLILVDAVARTALAPAEIPIGVVTAFLGAPFFALILRTSRRMVG